MIEEKELRLGNLYATDNEDEVIVKGIDTEKKTVIASFTSDGNKVDLVKFKNLHPIKLTEKNVLNLGFKFFDEFDKKKYFQIDSQSEYGILFDDGDLCFYYYHKNEGYTVLLCDEQYFRYVHHVQNLYFALTGQEVPVD